LEEGVEQPAPTIWSKIANNEIFTNVILVAIIASSIMLALETPTFPLDGRACQIHYLLLAT
jgi:hypothetical protein